MQRVATAELTAVRRHLLMECIEAYLPLEEPHLQQFKDLLLTQDFQEARMLAKTSFEQGMEKGMEKGIEQGQRSLLRNLLEARFGPLSTTAVQRLEVLTGDRLAQLGRDLLRAGSLAELGLEDGPSTNGSE